MFRRISTTLAAIMLLSLVLPVVSYANSIISFQYHPDYGVLTGYVYTSDPDSVVVEYEADGTVTGATYNAIYDILLYDENNTEYVSVSYRVHVGEKPSSLTVEREGTVHESSLHTDRFLVNDSSLDLDAYRMQGQHYFTSVTAATYLPSGSNLVSFTPLKVDGTMDAINIKLPRDYPTTSEVNFDAITMDDFEITDQTVSEAVYFSSMRTSSSGELTFEMNAPLEQDHEYLVKLSSTSSGDEIKMPTDGTYTASAGAGYISTYSGNFYARNIVHFNDITIGDTSTDDGGGTTTPPSDEGDGDETSEDKDQQAVNEESLKNSKDGKVAVDIADGKKQVLLPAKAADIVGKNKLRLTSDEMTAEIPSEVLAQLKGLLTEDQLDNSQISFTFDIVSEEDTTGLLDKAKGNSKAGLKAAGKVYDFNLSVLTEDGETIKPDHFEKSITLTLKVSEEANQDLLGMYYISDEGELEYKGGLLADGSMTAEVSHFSKYAVLEYDKTYTDVAADYWAADVIKILSAKHIVEGMNGEEFAPQADMKRAEFAALIVRALGLTAQAPAAFTDVDSSKWYAEAVAAANEAGIINGRSETIFAPEDSITREEMVTMIVLAYELKTGSALSADVSVSAFDDKGQASAWAQPYIDAAYEAQIVTGRENNLFVPQGLMTRAEGARIIYNLLNN